MPGFGITYRKAWKKTGRTRAVPRIFLGVRLEIEEKSEIWYERWPRDPNKRCVRVEVRWRAARRSDCAILAMLPEGER
ncbi:MAG: hypothetical protein CML66_25760 [Rhodobacteraceae bacterium]|nr:hypothetical protein [Paracoccaceae bacterium]MAY44670.1 hypothetical protein [Paracoccaceae bacterium]|tara:strand:- start:947 stop:1180 length:234 start_codon:yes stop_codon:yes gene_type:complete